MSNTKPVIRVMAGQLHERLHDEHIQSVIFRARILALSREMHAALNTWRDLTIERVMAIPWIISLDENE